MIRRCWCTASRMLGGCAGYGRTRTAHASQHSRQSQISCPPTGSQVLLSLDTVQYWDTRDQLVACAASNSKKHRSAWNKFNQRRGAVSHRGRRIAPCRLRRHRGPTPAPASGLGEAPAGVRRPMPPPLISQAQAARRDAVTLASSSVAGTSARAGIFSSGPVWCYGRLRGGAPVRARVALVRPTRPPRRTAGEAGRGRSMTPADAHPPHLRARIDVPLHDAVRPPLVVRQRLGDDVHSPVALALGNMTADLITPRPEPVQVVGFTGGPCGHLR